MRANLGCSGNRAIRSPSGVTRPVLSSVAPSRVSRSLAAVNRPAGGGSSHGNEVTPSSSRIPHVARSSANGARSALTISGSASDASCACVRSLHSL